MRIICDEEDCSERGRGGVYKHFLLVDIYRLRNLG